MKAIINKQGYLQLSRAGKYQTQVCPYRNEECGDWCPLFGEPEYFEDNDKWEIGTCGAILEFDEFDDER